MLGCGPSARDRPSSALAHAEFLRRRARPLLPKRCASDKKAGTQGRTGGSKMASSANRILTTHVGSLVRPPQLIQFLHRIEGGPPYDKTAYEACLKDAIDTVVRQQAEAGIDIVSDGEFSKGRNWAFYVHDRLSGVSSRPLTPEEAKDPMAAVGGGQDRVVFPEFYAEYDRASGLNKRLGSRFVVNGALSYSDVQVKRDIGNLKGAGAQREGGGALLPGG